MAKPKLRFKEFFGDWEEKKLGDIFSFKNGINANKEQYGKGYKFINVLDIINNNIIIYSNIVGYVNVSKEIFDNNKVQYGDILFQRSSETREEAGQSNVYLDKNKSATFGGFVIRGKNLTENIPEFMNYMLKTKQARKEISQKSNGSTRYNVGQDTLSKVIVFIPNLFEQEKIATFLSSIDKKIELQEKKLKLLKSYKKGLMQKIFSQELRFKDDDGNEFPKWEVKRLREIYKIVTGTTPSTKIQKYWNGNIPWITPTDINEEREIYKSERLLTQLGISKGRFIPKNSLLVTCIASIGKNAILKTDGSCNQQINAILPSNNNNIIYLYYLIEYKKEYLIKFAGKSATQILNKKSFSNLNLSFPSLEEQNKIANFLSNIDKKIEISQKELELTKDFKKALLQQMFV